MSNNRIPDNTLFIDLFSPKSFDSFCLPKRVKEQLSNGLAGRNLMFSGEPGIGKSSIAKFLLKEYSFKYINASESGNIDTLRGDTETFCTTVQLKENVNSDIKYVMFDEIDGASDKFFDALKGFMDSYSRIGVRFIATTNYYHKLKAPIQSRFQHIDFDYVNENEKQEVYKFYRARIKAIITKSLEMNFDEEAENRLINSSFPDFRTALQTLESLYRSGIREVNAQTLVSKSSSYTDVFELIINGGGAEKIYSKVLGKYATNGSDILAALHKSFPSFIESSHKNLTIAIPKAIEIIWENQKSLPFVIDPALCAENCILQLSSLIQTVKLNSKINTQ